MTARRLELSHHWGQHPLWDVDQGIDVDPASLPLPQSVIDRLDGWAARWDTTFDMAHPETPKVEAFVLVDLGRDGARLWRALLGLLPPSEWQVVYVHDDVVYRTVDDLPVDWRVG